MYKSSLGLDSNVALTNPGVDDSIELASVYKSSFGLDSDVALTNSGEDDSCEGISGSRDGRVRETGGGDGGMSNEPVNIYKAL